MTVTKEPTCSDSRHKAQHRQAAVDNLWCSALEAHGVKEAHLNHSTITCQGWTAGYALMSTDHFVRAMQPEHLHKKLQQAKHLINALTQGWKLAS